MLNDVVEQAQKEADITAAFMFKRILEDENGRHNHFTASREEVWEKVPGSERADRLGARDNREDGEGAPGACDAENECLIPGRSGPAR
jgi:hypothetical protein